MNAFYLKKLGKGNLLKSLLLALLLSVAGLMNAQDFTVGDLNYSVNEDDVSVAVTGHVDGNYANGVLIIPETVTYDGNDYTVTIIASYAFNGCDGLTGDLVIPNSIVSIESSAFRGCLGFYSLTLSNSLSVIDGFAFRNCSGLTSVDIPNSVSVIGDGVFQGCSNLISINIPNSVNQIGGNAFEETEWYNAQPDGLLYLDNCCLGYKGSEPTGDLQIAEDTRVIADFAFYQCSGLTSVNIPNAVSTIGKKAFLQCSSLTSFNIPNSVNYVGYDAFNETGWYDSQPDGVLYKDNCCISFKGSYIIEPMEIAEGTRLVAIGVFMGHPMTSLTLPNSLDIIGSNAFLQCVGLTSIETQASTPPSLGEFVFEDVDHSIPVTVPNGTLEAYQSAWGWDEFTNWVETPAAPIDEIYVEGFTAPVWGMHPDFNLTVPADAHYAVDEVSWFYDNDEMSQEDVFSDEEGIYYMLVYITPEEGYEFDPYATVFFDGDAGINDASYNDILSDGTFEAYTVDFQVTVPTSNIIDEIYVEGFTAPAWGEHPDFEVTVPAGSHYGVDEVFWLYNGNEMSEGDVFDDEGGTYYMLVYFMPEEAYVFDPDATVYFNGDATVNDAPYNAIFTDGTFGAYTVDYQVTAPVPSTYTVTATANPSVGGTAEGGGTYSQGDACTLTATANSGYQFLNWTKNGAEVSTRAVYSFTVTESAQYVANFIQSQTVTYTLTVMCDPSMGAVTGNGTYAAGTVVTVEAIPYKGFAFDRWNDGVTANPREVTLDGNMTLVAFFVGTGVDENGEALLGVYPNPARESVRIEGVEENAIVEIYNSLGMMVRTLTVAADEEINVSDLPQGVYMVRCGRRTTRFIVK